jgi:hypothetical protein
VIDHLMNNDKYREVFKAIHGTYPFTKKSEMKLWTDSEVILAVPERPEERTDHILCRD